MKSKNSNIELCRNKPRLKAKGIIVHCSDSPQGRGDDAKDIDRWHKEKGWFGIGYHYVITEDGLIQDGRRRSRSGAHAKGYNHFVGICLIGIDSFTKEQLASLEILINALDTEDVRGHYAVSHKTCPNINIDQFMSGVRERTEISKTYGRPDSIIAQSKTPHEKLVEGVQQRFRDKDKPKVQGKVQPKESNSLLDRIKNILCALCR